VAVSAPGHGHDAGTAGGGKFDGAVGAAVVGNENFAFDTGGLKASLRGGDAGDNRFGLVEARHHNGDFDVGSRCHSGDF
jgi:hypothetical protein